MVSKIWQWIESKFLVNGEPLVAQDRRILCWFTSISSDGSYSSKQVRIPDHLPKNLVQI